MNSNRIKIHPSDIFLIVSLIFYITSSFTIYDVTLNTKSFVEIDIKWKTVLTFTWFLVLYPFLFIILQTFIMIHNNSWQKHQPTHDPSGENPTFLNNYFRLSLLICTIVSIILSFLIQFDKTIIGTSYTHKYLNLDILLVQVWVSTILSIVGAIIAIVSFIFTNFTYKHNLKTKHYIISHA